jgi:ABC-type nitrate/sulfonate/bicarbonate transport system permease component
MLAAKSGLGFLIFRGMEVFDISLVMAGMVCIGLTGAFLAFITNIVERKLCPWNRGLSSE